MDTLDFIKEQLGKKSSEYIKDGMTVGLGSGSTSECFIKELANRCKQGLDVQVVSSSKNSSRLAEKLDLKLLPLNEVQAVDLTVDGADEIDEKKNLIKGGGGCHLQEKILAYNSKKLIIIADESKLSSKLRRQKLPVEVIYYGALFTEQKLKEKGYQGEYRKNSDGSLFFTDNAHLLYDIHLTSPIDNPKQIHFDILSIPGVVETGLFFEIPKTVLIGYQNGDIKEL